ncbi:hypothetical protein [Nesterenkonia suensis]
MDPKYRAADSPRQWTAPPESPTVLFLRLIAILSIAAPAPVTDFLADRFDHPHADRGSAVIKTFGPVSAALSELFLTTTRRTGTGTGTGAGTE